MVLIFTHFHVSIWWLSFEMKLSTAFGAFLGQDFRFGFLAVNIVLLDKVRVIRFLFITIIFYWSGVIIGRYSFEHIFRWESIGRECKTFGWVDVDILSLCEGDIGFSSDFRIWRYFFHLNFIHELIMYLIFELILLLFKCLFY